MNEELIQHDVFISYGHHGDQDHIDRARAIREAINRITKPFPWNPGMDVWLDQTHLPVGSSVETKEYNHNEIVKHLKKSKAMLVIASSVSDSTYVNFEIEQYVGFHANPNIVVAWTDIDKSVEMLPEALRNRPERENTQLEFKLPLEEYKTSNSAFMQKISTLIPGLRNSAESPAAIFDQFQRVGLKSRLWSTMAILFALLVVVVGIMIYSLISAEAARKHSDLVSYDENVMAAGQDIDEMNFMSLQAVDAALTTTSTPTTAAKLFEQRYVDDYLQRKPVQLEGHSPFEDADYTGDGSHVITLQENGTLTLWDYATSKALFSTSAGDSSVGAFALSPDGKTIAVGLGDSINLWRITSGNIIEQFKTLAQISGGIDALAFSPDGSKLAASGSDQLVRVWDIVSSREVGSAGAESEIESLAWSPDGNQVVAGTALPESNGTSVIFVDTTQQPFTETHPSIFFPGAVQSIAYSPDGAMIAIGGLKQVVLWSVAQSHISRTLAMPDNVMCVSFAQSPFPHILAVGNRYTSGVTDAPVTLWNADTGDQTATLEGHDHQVNSLQFANQNRILVTAGDDDCALTWNLAAFTVYGPFSHDIQSLACSTSQPITGECAHGGLMAWNVENGKDVPAPKDLGHDATCVAYDPAEQAFVVGFSNGDVRTWQPGDSQTSLAGNVGSAVSQLACNTNGDIAILQSNGSIGLDRSGRPTVAVATLEQNVQSIAISNDGTVAVGCGDGTVALYGPANSKVVFQASPSQAPINAVAFSPDGHLATGGGDGKAMIWDASRLMSLSSQTEFDAVDPALTAELDPNSPITSIDFTSDGSRLAVGCQDSTIRVWDSSTFGRNPVEPMMVLSGPYAPIRQIGFAENYLVSANGDGTTYVW